MDRLSKDRLGGLLLVAVGVAVIVAGVGYGMGTLRQMGSGFFPVVLGVLMALVGLALLATAPRAADAAAEPPAETAHLAGPVVQWRGWLCILAGVLSFVVLGEHGGLVPATFASVFVAALGDRKNSWRAAAGLAALMTLLGVVLFHYGLHLLLPLFTW
jgi:Tripartite tricarboxylate transporter TctB family